MADLADFVAWILLFLSFVINMQVHKIECHCPIPDLVATFLAQAGCECHVASLFPSSYLDNYQLEIILMYAAVARVTIILCDRAES